MQAPPFLFQRERTCNVTTACRCRERGSGLNKQGELRSCGHLCGCLGPAGPGGKRGAAGCCRGPRRVSRETHLPEPRFWCEQAASHAGLGPDPLPPWLPRFPVRAGQSPAPPTLAAPSYWAPSAGAGVGLVLGPSSFSHLRAPAAHRAGWSRGPAPGDPSQKG